MTDSQSPSAELKLAIDAYDRFVMGGWEPIDFIPTIERYITERTHTKIEAMRERAAKVAQNRANGFYTGECERGHIEWDTNAFVCSNHGDCLCIEREEEAEAIAAAIRALPIE